jgi:hypothetical protein
MSGLVTFLFEAIGLCLLGALALGALALLWGAFLFFIRMF